MQNQKYPRCDALPSAPLATAVANNQEKAMTKVNALAALKLDRDPVKLPVGGEGLC
jgi:hypothetical protein